MSEFSKRVEELRKSRDQVALKMHLASMEVREDWDALEAQWENFKARVDVEETAEGVGQALELLYSELRDGYKRLRRAVKH